MKQYVWSLVIFTLVYPAAALATENLGTLSISDVLLRPSFTVTPTGVSQPGFTIGESSLAVQWKLDESYSGHIRLGSEDLVAPPAHYVAMVDSEKVEMVEAYAQFESQYGRFRFGKLPIDFGLEGAKSESELIFPRALLFEHRIVGLRDLGFGYDIDYNGYFTEIVVHNGEGGNDLDNQYWYTARWGYDLSKFRLGLAGQTGHTTPASTMNSGDTLADVDPTHNAKWRMGGLFFSWRPKRILFEGEGYLGERVQDADGGRRFATGHADFGYEYSDQFSSYLRYDALDPDLSVTANTTHRAALAIVFTNKSRNSRLILMAAHDFNEGGHDDEQYRLIWSLSPSQLPSSFY